MSDTLSSPLATRPTVVLERRGRALTAVEIAAFALAIPGAGVGFAMDDLVALASSAALMGIGFVARDLSRWRRQSISPMTLYAFVGTLTALANLFAVLNQDTSRRAQFFLYAIDAHLPLALKIDWLGLVAPVLAFTWMMRSPTGQAFASFAPKVHATVPDSKLLPAAIGCAAFGIAANMLDFLPPLGTLTSSIHFLPHLAAFTLAQRGVLLRRPKMVWLALAIAAAEAVRALLFAYLRSDIISPIFAYAIGVFVGARSLRAFKSIYLLPIYPAAVVVVTYFAAFAEARSRSSGGVERLAVIQDARAVQETQDELPRHNLLTRLSSINQLTQVGRVVEEDGFLGGQTLEYLAYAWVPRFLWPEKPTIAKGAWFALRIGQARIHNGRITNSVNMTVRGELYLNYGWAGLLIGSLLFGALFAVLWSAVGALRDRDNVLGAAFAMYLLWIGRGGGADLQVVVTLIAMYLLFVASGMALRNLFSARGPTSASSHLSRA